MDNAGKNILLFMPEAREEAGIHDILRSNDYNVVVIKSLSDLPDVKNVEKFDLAIIGVWEKGTFANLSLSKQKILNVPFLLMLPSETDSDYLNKVKGCGDDFILLPVRKEEILLRAEFIIFCNSNRKIRKAGELFSIGSMTFDLENQVLCTQKGNKDLTPIETKLLHLLYLHKNAVLTREKALETIWGENDYFKSRSMDVYVSKLRKAFRHDSSVSITNIHKIGFRLNVKEGTDGRKKNFG